MLSASGSACSANDDRSRGTKSERYMLPPSGLRVGAEQPSSGTPWRRSRLSPETPDHRTESPVQAQLHLQRKPLDPVLQGAVEGLLGEIHQEPLPPNLELVRGPDRRPFLGPLLDRFRQRLPEAQFHLDPRAPRPMPEGNGVGGTCEFRRKVLKQSVPIAGGAMVVTHEGSLRCKIALAPAPSQSGGEREPPTASQRISLAGNPALLRHFLPFRRRAVRLLAELLPDFFPVHGNVVRGGDAQPYGFAFHRDDGDRQLTVRHHDSFADLATEDEHESSSLSKSSSLVPVLRKHPAQPATASRPGRETDTT